MTDKPIRARVLLKKKSVVVILEGLGAVTN
jgi:hypothetical protein